MTAKDEPVYIGIENPTEVRRALLESSKNLIKILQNGERLRENKRRKQEMMLQLKETMREIAQLISQLKSQMPRVRISSLPRKHAEKPIVRAKEADKAAKQAIRKMESPKPFQPPTPRPTPLTESQKLERELQDIEEKLKRL